MLKNLDSTSTFVKRDTILEKERYFMYSVVVIDNEQHNLILQFLVVKFICTIDFSV